ncbi:MAG TPA: hypothetical protein VGC42_04660 [Kofleriaceae bacterium]
MPKPTRRAVSAPIAAPMPPRRRAQAVPTLPAMPSTAATPPRAKAAPVPPVPPVAAPPPLNVAPPPPAVKTYPPFASSSKSLEERLQQLVAWIEACVPCRAAFIADDNGLPVVEHVAADPGQIAAASQILLMLASVRSLMRDSGGWLSLKLGTAILNVVEVATQWGRFGIGIVTDDALPREFLAVLSVAVELAFLGDALAMQGDAS